ncbi:MAG: ZIP family metal transporter [Chloroflexi bacterium]|nr:MAG: ZIP family metal transporter [Chloroflexota bacterium]
MIIEKESSDRKVSSFSLRFLLLPVIALILLVIAFTLTNPLALFRGDLPPVESLSFDRIRVTPEGFTVTLVNSGPMPVTVAQVIVDDAYWQYQMSPGQTIDRFERATLTIPYHWISYEPHHIRVISSTGVTFDGEVEVATLTPVPGQREFLAYGLLGIYIGVIPVALGLLWYPTMKHMGRRWLGAMLALTVGLLVFLLIDTFLEALEVGSELPGIFQGVPLALFSALLTWLAITAVSARARKVAGANRARGVKRAFLIAMSIGLHNFGEGLVVGAAFSLGQAALGSFLVIGFILHNITEGIGIAAPLVTGRESSPAGETSRPEEQPAAPGPLVFLGLALLAGVPAVLGSWIGGFAFSPLLATIFLGVGLGAIWQVIVEVVGLLRRYAERDGTNWVSGINLAGFVVGLAIMYFTAFLVKF